MMNFSVKTCLVLIFITTFSILVHASIPPPAAIRAVQCGAYETETDINMCKTRLQELGFGPIWTIDEPPYTKVLVGRCDRLIDAILLRDSLKKKGLSDAFPRSFRNTDKSEFLTQIESPDNSLLTLDQPCSEGQQLDISQRSDLMVLLEQVNDRNDEKILSECTSLLSVLSDNDPAKGFVVCEITRSTVRQSLDPSQTHSMILKVARGEIASTDKDRRRACWFVADGWHYYKPPRRIKAYQAYNEILDHYNDHTPTRVRAKVEIAACLLELARSEKAYFNEVRRACRQIIEVEPSSFKRAHAVADLMYGESLMFEGKLQESYDALEGFESRHPGRSREISMANEVRGWLLAKLDRWEESKIFFENNFRIDISDSDEHFYWGGKKWDMEMRSAVWLRSFADEFGDDEIFYKYDRFIQDNSDNKAPPDSNSNFAFPHSIYEIEE